MSAREILLEILGNKCELCSSTEDLEFHHINKDRSNNDIQNIQLLCKNCHRENHHGWGSPMRKFMMSVPDAMYEALEGEMRSRMLESIQETLRQIVSEHFRVR